MRWRHRAEQAVFPHCTCLRRPICLPCTEGTTRALRLPQTATCRQHKEELLPVKDVKALFVSEEGKKLTRKEVYIKNGDKKVSCERDATKAQGYEKVKAASEVVTPRFLCTGGVDPYADPNTCKGEVALWQCSKPTGPAPLPTASLFYRRFWGPSHCSQEKSLHSSE